MATSRDVQEIVSKLSSDKVKAREEGIKLLGSWLEGERSISFCRLLARNTAGLRRDEIPHSETWPFLITLLVNCIEVEITASKRRPPKLILAKTLRTVVQRAEDPKYSGFLRLFMERIGRGMAGESTSQSTTKEEVFRNILTFHILLENPPGDFPETLMDDVVKGFVDIFSNVREEGKISRKLMECVNSFLLKVGPNIGSRALDIHSSLQDFVFRCWLTTRDKCLKSAFFLYAKLQLNLNRVARGGLLIEELLDVIDKELDQTECFLAASKEDKFSTQGNLQQDLVELAGLAYYQACLGKLKESKFGKRLKRETPTNRMKDGIMKGKSLWCGSFYFLIHSHGSHIGTSLMIDWFGGICQSFDRILSNSNSGRFYDGFVWLLRALKDLSSLLPVANSEVKGGWHIIWNSLMQWLPIFNNIAEVVDVALMLLGDMILKDMISLLIVPQDIWELRIFKHTPSSSALYFFACYFSKRGVQNDLGDVLNIRRNLLRAALGFVFSKETPAWDQQLVVLRPAALCSLCAGCNPFSLDELFPFTELVKDIIETPLEMNDYSVEVLAEFRTEHLTTTVSTTYLHSIRLPRDVRLLLFNEAEDLLLNYSKCLEVGSIDLPDLLFICSFLCNCFYGVNKARSEQQRDSHFYVLQYIRKLLDHIASVIEQTCAGLQKGCCLPSCYTFDPSCCMLASFKSLICSPFFSCLKNRINMDWEPLPSMDGELLPDIVKSLERTLLALVSLFKQYSMTASSMDTTTSGQPSAISFRSPDPSPLMDDATRIVDLELDIDDGRGKTDHTSGTGLSLLAISTFSEWKLKMLSTISLFFSVLPVITWKVMLDLAIHEDDEKTQEHIIFYICKNSSCHNQGIFELEEVMINHMDGSPSPSNCFSHILTAVCALLKNTCSVSSELNDNIKAVEGAVQEKTKHLHLGIERVVPQLPQFYCQNLRLLVDVVNKIEDINLPDWCARIKLIECISCFILLDPSLGQAMIARLLAIIHDVDYRVRIFLAKRIGLLFQTWDGHGELFQDICSNLRLPLVLVSRDKIVRAREVLASGIYSSELMETVVVTLANIAFHSVKLELEVVFMICAIAALNPCQRALIFVIFDNLSQKFRYTSRAMYLKEVMGTILFWWITCEIGLAKLIEIQDLFIEKVDVGVFMNTCCPWLVPSLLIFRDNDNLTHLSRVTAQPVPVLARNYFVQIFAICIALHCSDYKNKNDGELVLHSSLLTIAEISEHERDRLTKKHMVAIVSQLLGVASSSEDPALPYFSPQTIKLALRTVVDGFLETDTKFVTGEIADRLDVFRPDRVFKFLVEIHFQIEAAVPPRHRCHRLLEVEILVDVLGHRTTVPSTSLYIFSIVGQFIESHSLQDQCCIILSKLLAFYRANPTNNDVIVLGRQIQLLVSKLVACYIPSNGRKETRVIPSSRIMSLIQQLTIDADSSFHDFIRDLEPFPRLECFEKIRSFHEELCPSSTPREQFLKFVKKAHGLSLKFFRWRLQDLHQQLLQGKIIDREHVGDNSFIFNYWDHDPEVASAVWDLVSLCSLGEGDSICEPIADFMSRVGIGDPYQVVFRLPRDCIKASRLQQSCGSFEENPAASDFCISEEHLATLIRLLMTDLSDGCAKTVDLTSQALQGILSTERGNASLQLFDSFDRSLITIHSKGVNNVLVERLLLSFQQKYNGICLEDPSIWTPSGKVYKAWICQLVHSLITICNDIILKLCQDVVLLKEEIAEFLFPVLILNIAGRKELNTEICRLVSKQVQERIFIESNNMIKSVQVFLDALNVVRSYNVNQKASSEMHTSKPVRFSSSTRTRKTKEKTMDLSWEKVYWLVIDYDVVAKAALRCGSFFTALLYVEYWCEEHFNQLTLGNADFSNLNTVNPHIELLVAAVTQINEPDSIYGLIQSHELTSQLIRFEHEDNWNKALEYYDLLVRTSSTCRQTNNSLGSVSLKRVSPSSSQRENNEMDQWKSHKGLMRSLQQIGCTHVLEVYCHGLTGRRVGIQNDTEFVELQYEAAWRAGDWDFSLIPSNNPLPTEECSIENHFNEKLHCCLRAFLEGNFSEFDSTLKGSKKRLVISISNASHESTRFFHLSIAELQILHHLRMAWNLRWGSLSHQEDMSQTGLNVMKFSKSMIPNVSQMKQLDKDWIIISNKMQLNFNMLEPLINFRRVILRILDCKESRIDHLLKSASCLRKGSRFSLAVAALHEFKLLCIGTEFELSQLSSIGRIEEAKVLWAQGQPELAINLGKYILGNCNLKEEASSAYRLVGKWLAETRSCNSSTILEQYLKRSVELAESGGGSDEKCVSRQYQSYFQLAHYTDALFRSYEDRLASSEWQAALRLRKHKTKELDALIKRLKRSTKGEKTDYAVKIQELQKQLTMDREEAEKLQDDRDNFLNLALEGYQRCLVIGGKSE